MQELITVRLTGHETLFLLTRGGYAILQGYLDGARAELPDDPDGDEVVRDLESAIGDRLAALRSTTVDPISGEQVRAIVGDIGAVQTEQPLQERGHGVPRGRFWRRIEEGKWLGGICLGIAAYGHFRVDWVRTVVLLLTLFTGGLLAVIYLVLLLVLPVVPTMAEYERRRGNPPRNDFAD